MADQEFLASFAVDIDEAGVARLQTILSENRELAEGVSAAFDAASESIRSFAEQMGLVSDFSAGGITAEGMSGLSGLKLGLDLTPAQKDLNAFIALAKKPIPLSAGGSGIVSAGQSAYNSIKSIFCKCVYIFHGVIRWCIKDAVDVISFSRETKALIILATIFASILIMHLVDIVWNYAKKPLFTKQLTN